MKATFTTRTHTATTMVVRATAFAGGVDIVIDTVAATTAAA